LEILDESKAFIYSDLEQKKRKVAKRENVQSGKEVNVNVVSNKY